MSIFDNEFDIFTFDIGHGKGHGHTNQGYMGMKMGNNQGFVKGTANLKSQRSIKKLRGRPGPVDGQVRRYDKATVGGSDYQRGVQIGRAKGAFGYDEEASTGNFANKPLRRRQSARRSTSKRPSAPRRRPQPPN